MELGSLLVEGAESCQQEQSNLEEAEKMLTEVDMTKFASYQWVMRAGVEKGIDLPLIFTAGWSRDGEESGDVN
jgi:hypothetical protein